jgi:WD40 repeat protein/class 3 adenylate cyclase/tRNA A-37 threonylcarbamoyl transferase component Bud32
MPSLPTPATETGSPVQPARHQTGLITIVFTDLVGSTALKQQVGDLTGASLIQRHHGLVRELLRRFQGGAEIETAGDSFLILFAKPSDAVRFGLLLHARLRAVNQGAAVRLEDRIGIHVGEVVIREQDGSSNPKGLTSIQVDTCARVMGLAEGGQILMTRPVFDNARQILKGADLEGVGGLSWLNHGPYLLKGVDGPLEVCEAREAGTGPATPPASSEKALRVAGDGELVLGWRPAVDQKVPGTQWLLEEKLGEGGFGEVWAARHEKLKERRVFKFCFRADRVRSLKREVTLFRLLKERVGEHPNIVKLYDVFFDKPPYYLVEEYVAGRDIRAWSAERGGLANVPLETRLEIVAKAAEGLQAAHEAAVIHRDIKPGNILVESQKVEGISVKISDFGIGQVLSEENLIGLTRGGFTQTIFSDSPSSGTGTHLYMAPELLAGKPASTRSDIYSLGVVLFQLLAGDFSRPVTTDWARQVSDSLLREDLARCFAGDPNERFGSAAELAKNLRQLPDRHAESERQQAEKAALERAAYRSGMMRTAAMAAVIVAVVTGLAIFALHESYKANAMAQREGAQRQRAETGEAEANKEKAEASHLLYVADMNLARQAWDENNILLLRELLDETQESPNRGFEWYFWQRQLHLDLKTLRGHLNAVMAVAFSSDGQRIVTASRDSTAKVWDAASGRALLTLKGHTGAVFSAAFSPDGQRIVTGSDDHTAKVWDAASGRELLALKGHTHWIMSVAFSPDGQRIVTGSEDKTAKVWDAASGGELLTLNGRGDGIRSVAFSPDGQRIVTGGENQPARVWEAASGRELLMLNASSSPVAFSPDGQRIVTGGQDNTARVWEAASGRELLRLKGHANGLSSVAFSPDGQRIVTSSWDRTAKVWEAASGKELLTLKGHGGEVWSVAFSPHGHRIVTGSQDKTAKVWEADGGKELLTLYGHSRGIFSVAFSPDGQRIVTSSEDQTAKVWEAASGKELLTLRGHSGRVNSARFSSDGERIVTGSEDQTAKVWEAASGKELLTLKGHGDGVSSMAFSPDGGRIVTGSKDRTAKVWEAAGGKELLTLAGHSGGVTSVAFSPDGRRIVTGSKDSTARIWESASGKELLTLAGHSSGVASVAFSPDGGRIVTGSDDYTARVWEAASGRELRSLYGHSHGILSVAFSPDGLRIVTGSVDQTARVWEAASGRELLTFNRRSFGILSVAFSPDGQRIVTGGWDWTANVWAAATAKQVLAWQAEEHDESAIKRWLILAPIPLPPGQSGAEGLDIEQIAGESRLRPRAGEMSSVGRDKLKWRNMALPSYAIDFNAIMGQVTEFSVAYAVTYIQSDTDRTGLVMLVGSDDQARIYLNQREIYREPHPITWEPDRDSVSGVSLKAGLNVLVFKVVNEHGPWGGSIRFTDAQGNPVQDIRVTLDPEGKDLH